MPNQLDANVHLHLGQTDMGTLGSSLRCVLPGQAVVEKDKSTEMMQALYQALELHPTGELWERVRDDPTQMMRKVVHLYSNSHQSLAEGCS